MSRRVTETNKETVEDMKKAYQDYLESGGLIEKCEYNPAKEKRQVISNINSKPPELLTLAQGSDLFGKKNKRKAKIKKIKLEDLEEINSNVLTGSAKELFDKIALEASNGGSK